MTATEAPPRDPLRRQGSAVWVIAGLLLILLVAASSSGDEALWVAPDTVTSTPAGAPAPADATSPAPQPQDESRRWLPSVGPLVEVVGALLAIVLVVGAAVAVVRSRIGGSWTTPLGRRRPSHSSSPAMLPEDPALIEADQDAMLAALREGPPRNAIVRCWMLLEQHAADAGVRREPAETSSEYVERVIGASSVDPRPILDLGALFRAARFSSRPIDETQRRDAEQALRWTLASLDGGPESAR